MILTFILLALSVCAVWTKEINVSTYKVPLWIAFFISAIASAVAHQYLDWTAVVGILVFCLFAFSSKYIKKYRIVYVLHLILIGGLALLLGLGKLPGFHNPAIVSNLQFTPEGLPFTQRLRIDGITAGVILLAAFCQPVRSWNEWVIILRKSAPIILVTLLVMFSVGFALNYVSIDMKFIPYTLVFFVANLLFTCVIEESFFRGFLQENFSKLLANWKYGAVASMVFIAVLFGLVHFAGGLLYMGLATLAGLFYGYAKYHVKHIEAAILTHFSVNAVHVVAFTFPNY